jgi:ferredoxin
VKQLVVDPIACTGHGLCADLFPEWIVLDDWGYPMINSEAVPGHLLAHAKRALTACPTLALTLREQPARDRDVPPGRVPSRRR